MRGPAWFRDRAVRKVAKHGVPVALGKVATAASGLVTLAILARYLGPAQFGLIALFRTVVTTVDLFANFNTWQAVIKYGTEAIGSDRRDDVPRLIKLAFVIDFATGLLGAAVVVGLAFLIPERFGWTSHEAALCALYGVTLITKVAGTSDGVFRICDAYRAQAIIASIMSVVMTACVAVAVALDASFEGCVIALVGGEVLSNIAVTMTAHRVANEAGFGDWLRRSLRGTATAFPGIRRFLLATSAQLTVRTAQGELDMIVVGSLLGRASAGLFRVIKQLGTIPGRVFNPFEYVLFTELARCSAAGDYAGFRRLLRRAALITGAGALVVWLVAAIGAEPMIELVAGIDYIAAAPAFRIYLFAMILQVVGTAFLRAMIALGKPGTLFLFDSGSLVVLGAAAIVFTQQWGLVGLASALVLHRAVQLVWSTTFIWRFLRSAEARAAAAGGSPRPPDPGMIESD